MRPPPKRIYPFATAFDSDALPTFSLDEAPPTPNYCENGGGAEEYSSRSCVVPAVSQPPNYPRGKAGQRFFAQELDHDTLRDRLVVLRGCCSGRTENLDLVLEEQQAESEYSGTDCDIWVWTAGIVVAERLVRRKPLPTTIAIRQHM